MKKSLLVTCALCIVFLSSCNLYNNSLHGEISDKSLLGSSSEVVNNNSYFEFFPVKTYGVYEIFNDNSYENEFDKTMLDNPIDQKMNDGMKTSDISGTREAQVFFDGYVIVWQDELEFSITNLKKYLTEEDVENFEAAQKVWEDNLQLNSKFDQKLMGNRGISLGTQYVSSGLLYLIDQYRNRVFHIKYMTMLAEEYIDTPVKKSDQTWNRFHSYD